MIALGLQKVYEFSNGIFDMLEGSAHGGPMIQIHATLDDVGNCGKDGFQAVVGYVAYRELWNKFNWQWIMTLKELGVDFLHTAHYLNQFFLADGKITDDDVALILAPFIGAVRDNLLNQGGLPICVITDCSAYDQLTNSEKKYIRPPDEHSFEIAVMLPRVPCKASFTSQIRYLYRWMRPRTLRSCMRGTKR